MVKYKNKIMQYLSDSNWALTVAFSFVAIVAIISIWVPILLTVEGVLLYGFIFGVGAITILVIYTAIKEYYTK